MTDPVSPPPVDPNVPFPLSGPTIAGNFLVLFEQPGGGRFQTSIYTGGERSFVNGVLIPDFSSFSIVMEAIPANEFDGTLPCYADGTPDSGFTLPVNCKTKLSAPLCTR